MTDLTDTISPGNEAFCRECPAREPVIERDDVSGAQVPRGYECYQADDCALYREAVKPETWQERDARLRHTPGELLAYALDDDEMPPVSAGEPT